MAGFVPDAFRAVLLEGLAGRTAIPTAPLYLGLATALPDVVLSSTLANISEVTTAGYARIATSVFNPATTVSPIQIWNTSVFNFASLTADMAVPAPWAFLTTAATGTAAPIRYVFQLAEAVWAAASDPIRVPAAALIIE